MPLGKFWEQSFKPDWPEPGSKHELTDFSGSAGPVGQRICTESDQQVERLSLIDKRFVDCEMRVKLKGCTFTQCHFEGCRFISSSWTRVKFSGCSFTRCHFFVVGWQECEFLDNCSFVEISASAEQFYLVRTELPAASFVRSLAPNLRSLPDGIDSFHQRRRFAVTKRKIAGAVLGSVRQTSDPINTAAAYREVVLAGIKSRIAEKSAYYNNRERKDTTRPWYARVSLTAFDRMEYAITWTSGWLTDWGQSLLRSVGYIICVIMLFGCIYAWKDPVLDLHSAYEHAYVSFVKSAEISLIFGYTAHRPANGPDSGLSITFVNALLGLYWYSLVVGAMTRRTLH